MLPILSCVIVFTVWLQYEIKKHNRKAESSKRHFIELESQANAVRKKPIDSLNYITISEKSLPFIKINDEKVISCQQNLLKFSNKKIVNLSSKTNTELKLEYGVGNLKILSEYDANFTELIRHLQKYAEALHKLSYDNEAAEVLQFSVNIGSDMKSTYCLLCDLYSSNRDAEKIDGLIQSATELDSLLKAAILNYLNESKSKINAS